MALCGEHTADYVRGHLTQSGDRRPSARSHCCEASAYSISTPGSTPAVQLPGRVDRFDQFLTGP